MKSRFLRRTVPFLLCAATIFTGLPSVSADTEGTVKATNGQDSAESTVKSSKDSCFTVTIPKSITLSSGKSANYTVTVSGDIAANETVFVNPVSTVDDDGESDEEPVGFYMQDVSGSSSIKDDIVATVEAAKTEWNYKEASAGTSEEKNLITASALTAGQWKGTLTFDIGLYNPMTAELPDKNSLTDIEKKDSMNDYTWHEISMICKAGKAAEYFSVGDAKTVSQSSISTNRGPQKDITFDAVVADIAADGTSMTMITNNLSYYGALYRMNNNNTASYAGGWGASDMRAWLNSDVLAALDDVTSAIIPHTSTYSASPDATEVSTCEDSLWLLSEKEVMGERTYENEAASAAEAQLAYFKTASNRILNITGDNSKCGFTLRNSLSTLCTDDTNLNSVDEVSGYITSTGISYWISTNTSTPLMFAFDVGYNKGSKVPMEDYTWDEIRTICKYGMADEYFAIGDTKTINLGSIQEVASASLTSVTFRDLAAQTATVTVANIADDGMSMDLMVTSYSTKIPSYVRVVSSGTDGNTDYYAAWPLTSVRKWLNESYLSALDEDLQNAIIKHSSAYAEHTGYFKPNSVQQTYFSDVLYSEDLIWLPSAKELFGTVKYENPATAAVETRFALETQQFQTGYCTLFNKQGTYVLLRSDGPGYSVAVRGGEACMIETTCTAPYQTCDIYPVFTVGYDDIIGETIEKVALEDLSWDEIATICKKGLANEYFTIGDTKTAGLASLTSYTENSYTDTHSMDAQTITLRLVDIAEDGKSIVMWVNSYSSEAPQYRVAAAGASIPGYTGTDAFTWLNTDYYNALDEDLRNVMLSTKTPYVASTSATEISYAVSKVWLLSAKEIFGVIASSQSDGGGVDPRSLEDDLEYAVERQFTYFALGGVACAQQSGTANGTTNKAVDYLTRSLSTKGNQYITWDSASNGYPNYSGLTYLGTKPTYHIYPAFTIGAQ